MSKSKALNAFLAAVFAVVSVVPAQSADSQYIWRYTKEVVRPVSDVPGVDDPEVPQLPGEQSDVDAVYVAMVGEPFSADIPLKPGSFVSLWTMEGRLPAGIAFDADTGRFSGVPEVPAKGVKLSFTGLAPDGSTATKASVTLNVFETSSATKSAEYYGHTGRPVSGEIPRPAGVTVNSWVPLLEIPEGFTRTGNYIQGVPSVAGHYSLAFAGYDYMGREVAFSKVLMVVEDGPTVGHIDDVVATKLGIITISGKVERKVGKISWELLGDPLLANLSFDPNTGVITGNVPNFNMSATYRLRAWDSDGTSGVSNEFRITSKGPVVSLANVTDKKLTVGEEASFGFSSEDLTGSQDWSIRQGELPDGLMIDPATGEVSGIPTKVGLWEGIVVGVATSDGGSDESPAFSIEVYPTAIEAEAPGMTHVRVGNSFMTGPVSVTGARPPYDFRVAEGSDLPAGLSLRSADGAIMGSLDEPGDVSVPLVLTDADMRDSSPVTVGIRVYANLGVTLPATVEAARLSPLPPVAAEAVAGSVMPTEDSPFGTFAVSGTLPAGVEFDPFRGTFSGTPLSEGSFGPIRVTLTDASGQTVISDPMTIVVGERLPLTVSVKATEVHRHVAVNVQLVEAENAAGDVSYELVEGTLPAGLSFNADGTITGSTEETGSFGGLVVEAVDSEGVTARTGTFALAVVPPLDVRVSDRSFVWPVNTPFAVPAPAVQNTAGTVTFSAIGLPAGTMVNPTTGSVSGTVAAAGDYTITVTATDSMGRTGTGTVSLTVMPPMTMTLASSHTVPRGGSASIVPTVNDAVGTRTFSLTGTLPAGLSFNGVDGAITGTPTSEGVYPNIKVSVTDAAGSTSAVTLTITVGPREGLTVAYSTAPLTLNSTQGMPRLPLQPVNAIGAVTWTVEGDLPPGVSFNTETGGFTGKPTVAGFYPNIRVRATDSEQTVLSDPFTLSVVPSGSITIPDTITTRVRAGGLVHSSAPNPGNAVRPLAFSAKQGTSLPAGMILDEATGVLSGIVVQPGSVIADLTVTDAVGRKKDFRSAIDAFGPLGLAYPATSTFNQHSSANLQPTDTNAIGAKTFVLSGTLPEGMEFNASTGRISGKPTQMGTFSGLSVTLTDAGGDTATANFSITVGPRLPLTATLPATADVIVAKYFNMKATTQNAVGDVTWSVIGTLPPGIQFNAATGTFFGTATELGSWPGIRVTATDSAGGTSQSGEMTFRVVTNGLPIGLSVSGIETKPGIPFTTASPVVSNAVGDVTYSFSGVGLGAYGFSYDPVAGTISGVVSQVTEVVVNVEVTDSSSRVTSRPLTISVLPDMRIEYPAQLHLNVNQAMQQAVPLTSYAIGAVSYQLVGTLPAGLSLHPTTGAIYGTPTQLGTFSVTVRGTDSVGDTQYSEAVSITVYATGVVPSVSVAQPGTFQVGTAISAITPVRGNSKVGDVFTLNKELPAGLVLNPTNGQITGTPAAGTHGNHAGYVMRVTDVNGLYGESQPFAIKIYHPLTAIFQNQTYRFRSAEPFVTDAPTYDATYVVGAMTYTIESGGDANISINPNTGVISGSTTSDRTLVIRPRDEIVNHPSYTVTINVDAFRVTLPSYDMSFGAGTEMITPAPTLFYPVGNVTYSLLGTLPAGLSFNASTGRISGIMPEGTFSGLMLRATDTWQAVNTVAFTLRGGDVTPNPFPLTAAANMNPSAEVTRGFTLGGISVTVNATIENGDFQVCTSSTGSCSSYTTSATVKNGDYIRVRAYAPADFGQTKEVSLTIGDTTEVLVISTRIQDLMPDAFSLPDRTGQNIGVQVDTGLIQIKGISDPVTINMDPGISVRICDTSSTSSCGSSGLSGTKVSNNKYVQFFTSVGSEWGTERTLNISVGEFSTTWKVGTRTRDLIPDPLTFAPKTGLERNAATLSEILQVTGITDQVSFSTPPGVGSFRVCSTVTCSTVVTSWTTNAWVQPNQYVQLQMSSPATFDTEKVLTLTAADFSTEWTIRTRPTDIEPDPFDFTPLTDLERNVTKQSEVRQVTGITDPTTFSTQPGTGSFRVCTNSNCGNVVVSWTTSANVSANQYIQLQMVSPATFDTEKTMVLTAPGFSAEWTIRTRVSDIEPDPLEFTPLTGLDPNVTKPSEVRQVTGITDPVQFQASGGTFRVCTNSSCSNAITGWTTSANVNPNQYVQLQMSSPATFDTEKVMTLTAPGFSAEWSVRTRPASP